MSIITVKATLPDVQDALALYDRVQVWRAPDNAGSPGAFSEISAEDQEPAILLGTVSAPFSTLAGKTLYVSLSGGDPFTILFSDIGLLHVLNKLNEAIPGIATENSAAAGKLVLTSPLIGTGSTVSVSGNAAPVLGLGTALVCGKGARPQLTKPTTIYYFKDYGGSSSHWYKWRLYSSITKAAGSYSTAKQYDPALEIGTELLVTGTLRLVSLGKPVAGRRIRLVPLEVFSFVSSDKLYSALPAVEAIEAITDERGVASVRVYAGLPYSLFIENSGFRRTIRAPENDFDLLSPDVSTEVDPFGVVYV